MRRKPPASVYRVTGVPTGRSEDIRRRYRRYAISMGIRTLCFVASVLTHGVARWTLLAAALLLPYIAVVMANGGRERERDRLAPVVLPSRTELPRAQPDPPSHPTPPTRMTPPTR